MKKRVLNVFVFLCICSAACSDNSTNSSKNAQTGISGTGDKTEQGLCGTEYPIDTYAANMQKVSMQGLYTLTLQSASPAPVAAGNNVWVVHVTDQASQPVANLNIVTKLWMPEHGHGSDTQPVITTAGLPAGTYQIGPLYLFMPGLWQITLTLSQSNNASTSDTVMFSFCVPG